jgi:hypothetical protein
MRTDVRDAGVSIVRRGRAGSIQAANSFGSA